MLTDQEILTSLRKTNPNATQKDVDAGRRFMRCFDCEDAATWEEAHEKICASMRMMNDEIDLVEDDGEARRILRERLAKF